MDQKIRTRHQPSAALLTGGKDLTIGLDSRHAATPPSVAPPEFVHFKATEGKEFVWPKTKGVRLPVSTRSRRSIACSALTGSARGQGNSTNDQEQRGKAPGHPRRDGTTATGHPQRNGIWARRTSPTHLSLLVASRATETGGLARSRMDWRGTSQEDSERPVGG